MLNSSIRRSTESSIPEQYKSKEESMIFILGLDSWLSKRAEKHNVFYIPQRCNCFLWKGSDVTSSIKFSIKNNEKLYTCGGLTMRKPETSTPFSHSSLLEMAKLIIIVTSHDIQFQFLSNYVIHSTSKCLDFLFFFLLSILLVKIIFFGGS